MAKTLVSDMLDVQILEDVVRGVFRSKKAFIGSTLVSSGAVNVSGSMPQGGPNAVGKKIDIPYFGILGEFAANSEGTAVTPSKLAQKLEQATIERDSLATEASAWSQALSAVDPAIGDPYQEGARQIMMAAERAMDKRIIDKCKATPLVKNVYSATTPVYVDWDLWVDGKTLWGDEQDEIVAAVVHSQTLADMSKLKDSTGRPLLLMSQEQGPESVTKFCGVPLIVSDRVPLDGSTMGTVTSSGTTPPVATLAGTPLGPWNLVIDCTLSHASNSTILFSTDGGNTFSDPIAVADDGVPVALIDPAADSLVGMNGKSGLTVAFASGTFNADNAWTSTANLKVQDMILRRGAAAFWYASGLLELLTDKDILTHTDILAMHLYCAGHMYRRCRGGSRPGVVAIAHNVRGYVG